MHYASMVPLPFDHGELVSKSAVHQCGHSARQSSVSYGRNCMTLKHLQEAGTSWHPPFICTVRAALKLHGPHPIRKADRAALAKIGRP